jgi:hypothetical protein
VDAAIETFLLQLLAVDQSVPGIAGGLTGVQFNWAPAPEKWSIGQCIEHLNITTERYIPVLKKAESDARAAGRLAPGPFALGFLERWFLRSMEPPPRRRFRTGNSFLPSQTLDPETTLGRFARLNEALRNCIVDAEGLDLKAMKVRSQFGPVWWSLNGTLAILLAHERRHLWQAREVRVHDEFPGA